jgi:Transglycosylase SLT domain
MDQMAVGRQSGTAPTMVIQAVRQAADRHGVDFDYLLDVARVESAMVPTAKAATSSARGLYQFTTQTWLATVDRHGADTGLQWAADAIGRTRSGRYKVASPETRAEILALRDDPATAAAMAARFTGDNQAFLRARTGRDPEAVDLYLAHFLGAGGAAKFLSAWQEDGDQAGAPLFPAAAAANRTIFYAPDGSMRSLDDIRGRFRAKLEQEPTRSMRAATFSIAQTAPSTTTRSQQVLQRIEQRPLPLMGIARMPQGLSLDFAVESYRRFASTSTGETAHG